MSKNKEAQDVRDIEQNVRELRKDVDKRLEELKAQMNVVTQRATRTVAERPLLALGVAFVAGMAVGIALSKAND